MSFYASYPVTGGSGGGVPTYANLAAFPSAVGAGNGSLAIALNTDILYISNGTVWEVLADPSISPLAITALTGDVTATGPGSVAATLATVNSNVGTFGTASSVSTVTVNAKGLTTAASNTSIQIAESQVTNLVSDLAAKQSTTLTNTHLLVGNASNVATDVAASGDVSLANTGAFTLATVNSNVGSFGTATQVPQVTVNAKGLTTAASNVAIQIAESQVTNLVTDLAAKQSTTLTNAHILVGNGSNVATDVAMSGDISIANTGATSIVATSNTSLTSLANLATVGTITSGTWSGTTIALNKGGTGQTTKAAAFDALSPMTTAGDVIYGGTAGTGTRLAAGSSTQVLHGGTTPSWSAVSLTADVTGTLAIGSGGTGQTTKAPAFDALSPMTTSGDIIYGGASGTGTRLAKGSDTQVLTLASGLPSWANPGALSATSGSDADTTMTNASASIQVVTPTANRTYTLPTTGIAQGQIYYFVNNAAVTSSVLSVLINASGGGALTAVYPQTQVTVVALQATPTTAAHWMVLGECSSNWHPYTLTIGATTTAPTPPGTPLSEARWKRVGNNMLVLYNYSQSGTGTAGTGTYLFPLPGSYTIDSSVVTVSTNDEGTMLGSAAALTDAGGMVKGYNSSNLAMVVTNTGTFGLVNSGGSGRLSVADMRLSFFATVPISGWGNNTGR